MIVDAGAPRVLYHYTSAEGLVGILRSREMWATDAEFLNDAQELQYGHAQLCEELESAGIRLVAGGYGTSGYNRGTMMKGAAQVLGAADTNGQHRTRVYVSCFCEAGDLLSQWRGYATGGYAVGFHAEALHVIDPRVNEDVVPGVTAWPVVHLAKVSYGPSAITSMIARVLETIAPEWVERLGKPGSRGAVHADTVAVPALASIKHDAFADEREWRLVAVGSSYGRLDFRISGAFGIVPYLALPLQLEAISEVVVGPGSHSHLRKQGVQRMLQNRGLDHVIVRSSRGPFRG